MLVVTCPRCGQRMTMQARFCRRCGIALAPATWRLQADAPSCKEGGWGWGWVVAMVLLFVLMIMWLGTSRRATVPSRRMIVPARSGIRSYHYSYRDCHALGKDSAEESITAAALRRSACRCR